jgi:glycosyltransferase involved in cell wall biosynthesis
MESKLLISVVMITYAQEKYIREAIEGVLMQTCDFEVELIIANDCSPDETNGIIRNIIENDPNGRLIKYHFQEENIGMMPNFHFALSKAKGKYIAICDGDDYWIDEFKLQKQVNFLEENVNYSIVYARTKKLYSNGTFSLFDVGINQTDDKTFKDLVLKNFIPSVTVMFKNPVLVEQLPNWFKFLPYGDWPLYLIATVSGGKVKFLNEIVSVYRMNIGESFKLIKQLSNLHKENLKILNYIYEDKLFLTKKNIIRESIIKCNENLIVAYNREGKIMKGFLKLIYLLKTSGFSLRLLKTYSYSIYIYFYKKL